MLQSELQMLVEAKNISKSYGKNTVLHPLSFSVKAGEVLGLLGANGGGKTTILRIITGLIPHTGGKLSVLGKNLPENADKAGREIAYMAQGFSMYGELTVRENLKFRADMYGIEQPQAVIDALLQQFGLEAYVNTRAMHLSGGWARILQLAASVLPQPKLLLLDEPTAGLDAYARQLVWQHIDELAKTGTGIVISTHDLNEASQCSNVLFLSDGKLLASGTPKEAVQSSDSCTYLFKSNILSSIADVLDDRSVTYSITREYENVRIVLARSNRSDFMTAVKGLDANIVELEPTLVDASTMLILRQKLKAEYDYV
ncbi:ABC transporter ATP-binding protein [Kordiimonas aquimaris]|uniref:ABC transporter ATP-binding protein n=1 Tax=Kordiimonas aquimaris TaxID=707591 RepID=UPI0021D1E4EB|nr:ABC transporter ATP-binding protein [Kordiimonas aquimaris]